MKAALLRSASALRLAQGLRLMRLLVALLLPAVLAK
jgi:hypothetical protein